MGTRHLLLKHHAYIMQSGNEAAAIDLSAAAGAVTEPDDVGAVLAKAQVERDLLGVVGQPNEPRLAVAIIPHENRELAAGQSASPSSLTCYDNGGSASSPMLYSIGTYNSAYNNSNQVNCWLSFRIQGGD